MDNHDLTKDPLWADYEHASESLKRLIRVREDIEADLVRRFSVEALAAWNDACHEEDRRGEELKSLQRAVFAKYSNLSDP